MINFQRGKTVKDSLRIGGYSFDTLRKGAIIEAKKSFSVSFTGIIQPYWRAKNKINKGNYLVISNIIAMKTKHIYWIKFWNYQEAREYSKSLIEDPNKFRLYNSGGEGPMDGLTQQKFDNRFEIIDPGF